MREVELRRYRVNTPIMLQESMHGNRYHHSDSNAMRKSLCYDDDDVTMSTSYHTANDSNGIIMTSIDMTPLSMHTSLGKDSGADDDPFSPGVQANKLVEDSEPSPNVISVKTSTSHSVTSTGDTKLPSHGAAKRTTARRDGKPKSQTCSRESGDVVTDTSCDVTGPPPGDTGDVIQSYDAWRVSERLQSEDSGDVPLGSGAVNMRSASTSLSRRTPGRRNDVTGKLAFKSQFIFEGHIQGYANPCILYDFAHFYLKNSNSRNCL